MNLQRVLRIFAVLLVLAVALLAECLHCFAATYTVNSSQTIAAIVSTAGTAAATTGNLVQFTAGTYPRGTYNLPCTNGVIYQGVPIVEPNQGNVPTAIFQGAGVGQYTIVLASNGSSYTSYGAGCTIRYFKNSGVGGFVYGNFPWSGIAIYDNYITLNDGTPSCTGTCAPGGATPGSGGTSTAVPSIFLSGNCPGGGGPVATCGPAQGGSYADIQSNVFYNNCATIRGVGYDAGGTCSSVWFQAFNGNTRLRSNFINGTEEGFKWNLVYFGIPSVMASIDVENNLCMNNSRICMESQQNTDGLTNIFSHNSFSQPGGGVGVAPYFATFELSIPINTTNPNATISDNVFAAGANSGNHYGVGLEAGGQGMNGQYNAFFNSNTCGSAAGFWLITMFGDNVNQNWRNNYFSGCNSYNGTPNNVGNAFTIEQGASFSASGLVINPNTVVQTSVNVPVATPTISPSSGSGAQTVTLASSDSAGKNVTIFYTTDGSTPAPFVFGGSAGTSAVYTAPFSVPGGTTVKAIASWGQGANQGISFTPYWGYVPSGIATVSYSGSSVPGPVFSPTSEMFTGTLNVTLTLAGATIYYTTDGSTPTPSSTLYTGPISVSATTTIRAIGVTGGVSSSITSGTYTLTPPPTLVSGQQGNNPTTPVNTLAVGQAAVQQVAIGNYSDSSTHDLPDAFGNTAIWSSQFPGILQVTSTGLISCLSAGTANSLVKSAPGNISFNPWTWTCNAAPTLTNVTLASTGGVTTLAYQATNQILATCHYSDGSTTSCNTPDVHGNGVSSWASSNGNVTINATTGVATGAVIGSSNISVVVTGLTGIPTLPLSTVSQQTLVSAYLTSSTLACNPTNTIQFAAKCHYSSVPDQDCTMTDIYGDAVTAWNSVTTADVTVNGGGRATCVAAGSSNITATVNGAVASTPSTVTVTNPSVTLTGVSLATTGGVTGLLVSNTNQLKATCLYSDGSTTSCNSTDSHGNQANTWASTTPGHATVNATTGLATGVAPGTTTFTAHAGSFTSPALPLTVLAIPPGTYTITVTGPVSFTGTVTF